MNEITFDLLDTVFRRAYDSIELIESTINSLMPECFELDTPQRTLALNLLSVKQRLNEVTDILIDILDSENETAEDNEHSN